MMGNFFSGHSGSWVAKVGRLVRIFINKKYESRYKDERSPHFVFGSQRFTSKVSQRTTLKKMSMSNRAMPSSHLRVSKLQEDQPHDRGHDDRLCQARLGQDGLSLVHDEGTLTNFCNLARDRCGASINAAVSCYIG